MTERKTLFMETTTVPADRTAAEITGLLVRSGATRVETEYEAGKIKGLRWSMRVAGVDLLFSMPARVEPIAEVLRKRRRRYSSRTVWNTEIQAQAERVAWRQLLRWVQAQVAMIECGMTESSEVFFPYLTQPGTGKTVYSVFAEQKFKAIGPPQ